MHSFIWHSMLLLWPHEKVSFRPMGPRTGSKLTLYRGKLETVEAFHYEAALQTMDFKYPFPDWLKDIVTVRENAVLKLDTNFGTVWVKPGQWVVKNSRGNLHILDPEEFHRRYGASSD